MLPPQARKVQPTVMDVWEWPEFRAFAQRLGIRLDVDCMHLDIVLDGPKNPVVILHKYACNDEGKQSVVLMPPGTFFYPGGDTTKTTPMNMERIDETRVGMCHGDVHIFTGMKIKCACGQKSRSSPRDTKPCEDDKKKYPDGEDISDALTGRVVATWDESKKCHIDTLTGRVWKREV